MNKKKILFIGMAAGAVLATVSHAAIIAGYDFDDGYGVGTTVVTAKNANVTASNYGVGNGLINVINGPNGNSNTSNLDAEGNVFGTATGLEFGGALTGFGFTDMDNANDLGLAITNNDYMVFTITPGSGYQLNLTSFTFRTRANHLSNSAERWALFSSVDGFADSSKAVKTGQTTDIASWTGDTNKVVIDMSASKFQNLTAATEFRLYIYGGNASTSSATLFDKVILNGNVIPEPSALALIGLGFVALLARRRRC